MSAANRALVESRTRMPVNEYVGASSRIEHLHREDAARENKAAMTARQVSEDLRRQDGIREGRLVPVSKAPANDEQARLRQAVREGRLVPAPASWGMFGAKSRPGVPKSGVVPVRESHAAPSAPPLRESVMPKENSSAAKAPEGRKTMKPKVDPVAALLHGDIERAEETADDRRRREVWERAGMIFMLSEDPDLRRFNREGFELAIEHKLDRSPDFTAAALDGFLKETVEMFKLAQEGVRESSGTGAFAG